MAERNLLEMRGIEISFPGVKALNKGDFTLREGEIHALLGENGCGKTTLLQALAGLQRCSGEMFLGETRWDKLNAAARAELLAYLPQEAGVLFDLHVKEILELALENDADRLHGEKRQELLRSLELETFLHRRYQSLSGGEKRRAMLARVFCRARPFTFLDEPTAPLDLRHSAMFMRYLAGRTGAVLAALHDVNLAVRYFDRFLRMKNGRILFDKTKDQRDATLLESIYGIGLSRCGDIFVPER